VAEQSRIKRYALVQNDSNDGMRRFHLARVTSPGQVADASRLERMEDVAAREGSDPSPRGEGSDPFSAPDSRGLTP
jgi:hypothetical protein